MNTKKFQRRAKALQATGTKGSKASVVTKSSQRMKGTSKLDPVSRHCGRPGEGWLEG